MTYWRHADLLRPLIVAIDLIGLRRWLNNVNAGYGFADLILGNSLRSRGHVSLHGHCEAIMYLPSTYGVRQL